MRKKHKNIFFCVSCLHPVFMSAAARMQVCLFAAKILTIFDRI